MKFQEFLHSFTDLIEASPEEELRPEGRYVVLSDLHMGDGGGRDDLAHNRALLRTALKDWYLARGYTLILAGDIEELHKFKLGDIKRAWAPLYAVFDAFDAAGRLRKIVGNHDLALLREEDYPYDLLHGLSLLHGKRRVFVCHGHQASRFFVKFNYLSDFLVRYLAKPLRIKNTSVSSDSRQRFKTERRIYRASRRLGIVTMAGHTHRPLFESLSKYDSLRWSMEEALRDYALAREAERPALAARITLYREEFSRLKKKDRVDRKSQGLYEEKDFVIPCLFNSGCATGAGGFTGLELEAGKVSLVHWSEPGHAKAYMEEEAVAKDDIAGGAYTRYVVRQDSLESIFARIDLLGSPLESSIAY